MMRRFSSTAAAAAAAGPVRSESRGALRIVTLDRQSALNSLDVPMVTTLHSLYTDYMRDRDAVAVLLRGEGRAFCAGGDVVSVYAFARVVAPAVCETLSDFSCQPTTLFDIGFVLVRFQHFNWLVVVAFFWSFFFLSYFLN